MFPRKTAFVLLIPYALSACGFGETPPQPASSETPVFSASEAARLLQTIDATNQKAAFAYPSALFTFRYFGSFPEGVLDEEIRIEEGRYLYWKRIKTAPTGESDRDIEYFYTDPTGQAIAAYDFGADQHYTKVSAESFPGLLDETLGQIKADFYSLVHTIDLTLLRLLSGLGEGAYTPTSGVSYSLASDLSRFESDGTGALSGHLSITASGANTAAGDFSYLSFLPLSANLSFLTEGDPGIERKLTLTGDYTQATPIYPDLSSFALLGGGFF
jgi:hypothetical protein